MSCGGGHGTYRVIERLLDGTLDTGRWQPGDYYARPVEPRADVRQEVKLMYAKGELSTDTFRRLMELAALGQLGWDDLARVRGEATVTGGAHPAQPAAPEQKRDTTIVSSLNRLHAHRTRLESARGETEQVLQTLEAEVSRLREQAKTAQSQAQQALPADEKRARAYLDVGQEAQTRIETLDQRIQTLRDSLRRIDTLHAELATREAELKALESAEQLAELEANIRRDLLNKSTR